MYNRYISGAWPDPPEPQHDPPQAAPVGTAAVEAGGAVPQFEPVGSENAPAETGGKGLGGLKSLFGGNIRLPEFNADTILLLVMVYFLVSDDSENISDTLLIIGVLLLLGF